jgi:hypothetical protein
LTSLHTPVWSASIPTQLSVYNLECSFFSNIVTYIWVTIAGFELDLLTTFTHHLELQAITALSLTSTLHKSLHAKYFPSLLCLQQLFPTNSADFSSFRARAVAANVPQLNLLSRPGVLAIQPRDGPNRKHRLQHFSIVVMGGCLAKARISLTCLPATTQQRMFLPVIVGQQWYDTLHAVIYKKVCSPLRLNTNSEDAYMQLSNWQFCE